MKKKLFVDSSDGETPNNGPKTTIENYIICPGSTTLVLENSVAMIDTNTHSTMATNLDDNSNNQNTSKGIKISRKKKRQPENWQRNKLKRQREAGEEYCNIKGQHFPAKRVKIGCEVNCAYKCATKFTFQEREDIKNGFYSLNDTQKYKFYNEFTARVAKNRKRTQAEVSRRRYSFKYFFLLNNQKQRVCQIFFCKTLDISVRRIYYFHKKVQKQLMKIVPTPSKGKHIKKKTSDDKIDEVIQHIMSFPTQESHFCRASTKRQYLDKNLSIAKMYSLYVESNFNKEPVKENIYRKIFTERFNLAFHRPKKDACDACWEFKAQKNPSDEQKNKYEEHIKRKEEGNAERETDRKLNDITAVITFDLENIFSLPKANISCFFYTSKLTVYNLTAHCNANKSATNATWDETKNGRSGDDLASALIKILKTIVDDLPDTVTKLILWSDSCVPQNRNSHMSVAIITFLQSEESKQIKEITQKYSEPGHGNVQEVDAVHSLIERNLRHQEIYSPLSLMRAFLKIKSRTLTLKFLQMLNDDFHCYHEEAIKFGFNQIPYSKVKSIIYNKSNWNIIQYKTSFYGPTKEININNKKIQIISDICVKPPNNTLSLKKIQDIRSSYKYMPAEDKKYMEAIIRNVLKEQIPVTKTLTFSKIRKTKKNKKSAHDKVSEESPVPSTSASTINALQKQNRKSQGTSSKGTIDYNI